MRTPISIIVAVVLLVFVGYLAYSGRIALLDYWTGLAVALTGIALGILYWGFKPQIDRFFNEKRKIHEGKAETGLSRKDETQKSALLPDNAQITQLNIDESLLDQIYEQARHKATDIYHDAQLSRFSIQAFPFHKVGAKVTIYLNFYSKWADKICTFRYSDVFPKVEHSPPDRRPKFDSDREVFTTLPWKESPQWMQFLNRAYAKIGPLASSLGTCYHLFANPPTHWHLDFEDGFSGNEYAFEWNGRGLDESSVKQLS